MRCCLICKIPSRETLCSVCIGGLMRIREPVLREDRGLHVRSLLSWDDEGPLGVAWLVRSLKRQESELAWRMVALILLQTLGPARGTCFVPVPSRHALGMARALSALTGIPLADVLLPRKKRAQKLLAREERREIGFLRKDPDDCTKYRNVILCDDVITTGATARAALAALGHPKQSQVWCLADRRPCGE